MTRPYLPDYFALADRACTTNGLNQYVQAGATALGYDANPVLSEVEGGNLTSDGGNGYVYDAENRLVSATLSGGVALAYDPLGRLWQTSSAVHGTTRFLYDGDRLAAEYDMAGAIRRRYAWGQGVDQPVLQDEGGALSCAGTRFLHTDHQGSIIATADCPGNRLNVNSYDDYGVPPQLGRFMQTDPIGYEDQMNLYAYVANDPVNNVDPDGEQRRPIVAPQMGSNAPRTLPEILRAQELRSRVAEINAVNPRLNRYVPTSIGPPAASDVRVATGVSRAANIVRPGIINSNPAASSSGQSAVANLRGVLGQGQFDGVTGKGAFHFTAGGGQNAQSAAMAALGANGANQTSLNFGTYIHE